MAGETYVEASSFAASCAATGTKLEVAEPACAATLGGKPNTVRVEEDYGETLHYGIVPAPHSSRESLSIKVGNDEGYKEEPLDEVIDGTVYMSPRPAMRHSEIVVNICVAIRQHLRKGPCRVLTDNVDFHYRTNCTEEEKKRDYISPDVIIVCDHSQFKRDGYYGHSNFVVEVLSPSTSRRDRKEKMTAYAGAGVSEYWIVVPSGFVEVYYLVDGQYQIQDSIILCNDKDDEDYNADQVITLREFPEVSVTVGEIFE